jgi:FtsP/CotA-like multicopper oxidase with cupredoxin domain
MVLSQIQVEDGAIVPGDMSSLDQQVTLINGMYQPTVDATPGRTQRWRLINAGSVFYRLQLEGHPLEIIGIDGNPLSAVTPTDVLTIPPGGRADVLVTPDTAAPLRFRSLSWKSFGIYYSTGMVPVSQTLATVQSTSKAADGAASSESRATDHATDTRRLPTGGAAASTPEANDPGRSTGRLAVSVRPTALIPFEDLRNAPIARRRVFELSEREPRGTGQLDKFQYFVNGRQFNPRLVNERMLLGTVEEWEMVNLTYEPHPVHIHVNPFQVIAQNGAPVEEHFYRDTALLPPFGSFTLRTRFADFVGLFVWHCHILFHEDNGMMQIAEVVPTEDLMQDGGLRVLSAAEYEALQHGLTGLEAPI